MSAEKNKALVRRFLQAHAKGDLDTMQEMLAPDFVDHNLLPGQRPGREGYLRAHRVSWRLLPHPLRHREAAGRRGRSGDYLRRKRYP
jgi:ketosteroid isomerase-like protein